MKSRFLPLAEQELAEAAAFYFSKGPSLAARFRAAVRSSVKQIELNPEAGHLIRKNIRQKVLSKFPYTVFYSARGNELLIVGVQHHRRKPRDLSRRLKTN